MKTTTVAERAAGGHSATSSQREMSLGKLAAAAVRLASRSLRWLWGRAAYALALLPILTDWIDTGHWPEHPRELSTEIMIGVLILIGVAFLYRRGDHFRTLAQTDALTGLGNRLRFRVDLEAAVMRSRDGDRPLALAFVDVDRFKEINDGLGHAAGDEALKEIACALERSVRQGVDHCYRIGGDEFAMLISGSDGTSVLAALSRSFRKARPPSGARLSCSVGVVTARHGESPGDLVRRADELMYAAKRSEVVAREGSDTMTGRVSSPIGRGRGSSCRLVHRAVADRLPVSNRSTELW